MFQYLAIWSAKKVQARPWGILVMLSLVTAVVSAFLDNVTTVLLVAPVTLLIAEELRVSAYPFLFSEILFSNIGGTATLIGDPPNIMIGSAVGLTFNDFVVNLTPVIVVVMAAPWFPIYLIWGRKMRAEDQHRERVMKFDEREAITDVGLLKQCLVVLGLVLLAFVFAHPMHLEPATIAMFGAALLLLLSTWHHGPDQAGKHVHQAFTEVEWVTIFFFIGLFIVVHGVDSTGLLQLAEWLVGVTGGDMSVTALAILWVFGRRLGGGGQHPVRGHDDPAHQVDGPDLRRSRRSDAALVVALAGGLPGRQRHPRRCERQPGGGGPRRSGRPTDPLRPVPARRLPHHAAVHRDQHGLSGNAFSVVTVWRVHPGARCAKLALRPQGPAAPTHRYLNDNAAMRVGGSAANSRPSGWTASSLKYPRKIAMPAGLGALAIMVKPPPVTAPATKAYLKPLGQSFDQ